MLLPLLLVSVLGQDSLEVANDLASNLASHSASTTSTNDLASDLATLHPADVDVYLVVPDVSALVDSMLSSPLLETLRDEGVSSFISGFTGPEPFDLDSQLTSVWSSQVPDEMQGMLQGLDAVSFSYQAGDHGPSFLMAARFDESTHANAALKMMNEEMNSTPLEDPAWPNSFRALDRDLPDCWLTVRGRHLLYGTDSLRTDLSLARLAGEGENITGNEMYTKLGAALTANDVQPLLDGFILRSPVTLVTELAAQAPGANKAEVQEIIGMNLLGGSHRFQMARKGDRYVTESFSINTGESDPLHNLFGIEPLRTADAASIPTGMLGALSTTIDAERLGSYLRLGLQEVGRRMGNPGQLESLEEELGFPLTQLFSHLGSHVTLQMKPIKGPSLPETAIWIDLKDQEAFTRDLAVIAAKLPQLFEGFEVRSREYKVKNIEGERTPYPITSLHLPEGLIDLPIPISISPSLTVADGRLLIGLSSTHVKRELKRLYGPVAPDAAETNPWAAAGLPIKEGAHCAGLIDWGEQIAGLVSLAKALGPMAGDAVPVDWEAIPEGSMFIKNFRPTVHTSFPMEQGTYHYHEASFGPEVWLAALSAGWVSNVAQYNGMAVAPVPVETK